MSPSAPKRQKAVYLDDSTSVTVTRRRVVMGGASASQQRTSKIEERTPRWGGVWWHVPVCLVYVIYSICRPKEGHKKIQGEHAEVVDLRAPARLSCMLS